MPSTLIKALTKARLAPYFHTTEVVATRYFGSGKGPMSERNRNAEGTTNDRQDQASPSHGNSQRRQTTLEEHNYARSSSSKKSKSGPRQGADSSRVSPRDHRAHLAQGVLEAIKEGAYTTSKDGTVTTWDLAVPTAFLRSNTAFYPHESPALQNWRQPADDSAVLQSMSTDTLQNTTTFRILECTTLSAARSFNGKARVGVLIFASATKPGGGFLTGAEAQEESLARASNLYASQTTQDGQRFYNLHKEKRSMYYSHSMIYSPSVSLIRDDTGEWDIPLQASMITSAAVNAGVLRQRVSDNDKGNLEQDIEEAMRERMGRILRIFEEKGDKTLVLGSFGTGVFKNSVRMVAALWAELLRPGARFSGVFDEVVFAIIGNKTYEDFRATFLERCQA